MDEEKSVTVYSSCDELEAARLAGMLNENGIKSFIQNANTQDLFGIGRMGTGYNLAVGAYNILILESDYEQAVALIKTALGLDEEEAAPGQDVQATAAEQDTAAAVETAPVKDHYDWVRSVLLSLFWVFGIGSFFGIFFGIKGYKEKPGFSLLGIVTGLAGLILTMLFFRYLYGYLLIILVAGIPLFLAIFGIIKYRRTRKILFFIMMLIGCLLLLAMCLLPVLLSYFS